MSEADDVRQQLMDERAKRTDDRLASHDKKLEALTELTIQISALAQNHDKQIANADVRICNLEATPKKRYDTIVNAVLQWLAVAVLAAAVVFK